MEAKLQSCPSAGPTGPRPRMIRRARRSRPLRGPVAVRPSSIFGRVDPGRPAPLHTVHPVRPAAVRPRQASSSRHAPGASSARSNCRAHPARCADALAAGGGTSGRCSRFRPERARRLPLRSPRSGRHRPDMDSREAEPADRREALPVHPAHALPAPRFRFRRGPVAAHRSARSRYLRGRTARTARSPRRSAGGSIPAQSHRARPVPMPLRNRPAAPSLAQSLRTAGQGWAAGLPPISRPRRAAGRCARSAPACRRSRDTASRRPSAPLAR